MLDKVHEHKEVLLKTEKYLNVSIMQQLTQDKTCLYVLTNVNTMMMFSAKCPVYTSVLEPS
jgi:hypothetical protein